MKKKVVQTATRNEGQVNPRSWNNSLARYNNRDNRTQNMITQELNLPDNSTKRVNLSAPQLTQRQILEPYKPSSPAYKPDSPSYLQAKTNGARPLFDPRDESLDMNDLDMGF